MDCANSEVEAYMERSRSQAIPGRLPSLPDLPQVNIARAGDVLDDTHDESAASEQHHVASVADNGHSSSADANRDGDEETATSEQQTDTRTADDQHSIAMDADVDTDLAPEQESDSSVGNNGHGASGVAQASESASGQEQEPQIPALTAETQPDAVLPSIQAVSEASDYASVPEHPEAISEASDYASIEQEPESDSVPEPVLESEPAFATEQEPASEPEPEPESEAMPEPESEEAQQTEASGSYDDATDQGEADADAAARQPTATRADFAEIQKLLGHAASEGSDASTESHHQEAASASGATIHEDAAESAPVVGAPAAAEVERADSGEAAETDSMVQHVQSEAQAPQDEDSAEGTDSAPVAAEAATVAASGSEAQASTSSERPSAGGFARLPSLLVRRGPPSLPSRPSTSTGVHAPLTLSPCILMCASVAKLALLHFKQHLCRQQDAHNTSCASLVCMHIVSLPIPQDP